MRKIISLVFLTAFSTLSIGHAGAKDNLGYVGLEMGYAYADIRADQTASVFVNTFGGTVVYEYDEADLAGRISGGYRVTDMLDLEVGYFFTADFDAIYNGVAGNGVVYNATETYSATGLDFSGLFRPTEGDFFIRLGVHNSEVEGVGNFTVPGVGSVNVSATESGTGLLLGMGYDWTTDGDSFARVSYSYYDKLGGVDNSEMGLLSISYNFAF